MARVTYGESITEYAGSIGGITYLRNASGPIAKLRSNPPVNPSPNQSTYQTRLAQQVAWWPTLSQVNKEAWDAIAAANPHTTPWGETKTLSGYQLFMSCNLLRNLFDLAILSNPGAWYDAPPTDQFTIETSSTYIRVAWDPAYDAPYDLLAYCSLPLRQSSLKLRRSLFFIHKYAIAPSMPNWDLTEQIRTLFNVTWSTFYASADCSIIIRLRQGRRESGYWSAFTSAIIKID
jgi:hypothetical protein